MSKPFLKGEEWKLAIRYCGRVVKAMDLKSIGFSRTGSNPVNVVFFFNKLNINDEQLPQRNIYSDSHGILLSISILWYDFRIVVINFVRVKWTETHVIYQDLIFVICRKKLMKFIWKRWVQFKIDQNKHIGNTPRFLILIKKDMHL